MLFPFFLLDGNLHTTLKITKESQIKTKEIISLFQFIDYLDELRNNKENKSYVKAEFKSPGEIWSIYTDIKSSTSTWLLITIASYIALFGNQKNGFDGIIDLETRRKIYDLIIESIKEKKFQRKSIKDLEVKIPDEDFTKIIKKSEIEKIDPNWDM